MWTPPSPDAGKEEVEEEPCVAVDAVDRRAIPFFTHESGAIFIKGGTVVNDDNMEVSDVIMEDGKITQVGQDLEVPSGKHFPHTSEPIASSHATYLYRSQSN